MPNFTVNRSLLNPKFEGYKFQHTSGDTINRYGLQYRPTQIVPSGLSPFSFQEVQSMITHNHLVVAAGGGRALYVDAEHRVILIEVNLETLNPSFRVLCELPKPLRSTSVHTFTQEYPSAAFLSSSIVVVADGHGYMYSLHIPDTDEQQHPIGPFELPTCTPFKIHKAIVTSQQHAVLILSSRNYDNVGQASTPKGSKTHVPVQFDLWAVELTLPEMLQPKVLWQRQGDSVPTFVGYDVMRELFLVIGSSQYRTMATPRPESYEPSPDEIAPIPRFGENLDDMEVEPKKPSPYSWTQTSENVTVAFPLPSSTSKNDIKVSFMAQSLTLKFDNLSQMSVPAPQYTDKQLWDGISVQSSYWTWDRDAEHTFGLLTLYLDKQHEGMKWMHVFAKAGTATSSESNPEDVDVPETLDPSELWQIREALEKYTSALREGQDPSGRGLGARISSLAEDEMDEDIDTFIGKDGLLTWINLDGSQPPWAARADAPITVLSTPLPGTDAMCTSLIVKTALDGALFALEQSASRESVPEWKHVATFSALPFVLASKQDVRFTHHVPHKAVLAFESGVRDRGGNVYVYRAHEVRTKWAQQSVLKAVDATAGSLLGIGAIHLPQGQFVTLALSESELTVIGGLL